MASSSLPRLASARTAGYEPNRERELRPARGCSHIDPFGTISPEFCPGHGSIEGCKPCDSGVKCKHMERCSIEKGRCHHPDHGAKHKRNRQQRLRHRGQREITMDDALMEDDQENELEGVSEDIHRVEAPPDPAISHRQANQNFDEAHHVLWGAIEGNSSSSRNSSFTQSESPRAGRKSSDEIPSDIFVCESSNTDSSLSVNAHDSRESLKESPPPEDTGIPRACEYCPGNGRQCLFYRRPRGCTSGSECRFCHHRIVKKPVRSKMPPLRFSL